MSPASVAKKLASVMISTSRLPMCESSCARTPSTSCGSSVCQSPVVTATAAFFGLRPVANAFGIWVSMIATFGLGRSASAQRRSIMSWSAGASSRSTILAPEASSASFADEKYWKTAIAPTITSATMKPPPMTWIRTKAKMT